MRSPAARWGSTPPTPKTYGGCHGRDLRHDFAARSSATRQRFISPESFTFSRSALVLAIVVMGGMGSQIGVAVAALVMLGGFELFRDFEQYHLLVFGMAMVAIIIWRPRGLVGTTNPRCCCMTTRTHSRPRRRWPGVSDAIPHGRASLTMRFGGLVMVAIDDPELYGAPPGDYRADRTERCRQDHRVQDASPASTSPTLDRSG